MDSIDAGPDTITGVRRDLGEARLDALLAALEEELALLGEEVKSDRPPPPSEGPMHS